ncbi:MAG: TetR/AcrR family transcriptional regulator [Rhizomicrobium sp.]|jgi:AcrR family transcriptional regulator
MTRAKKSVTPAERWSLPAQQDRSRATRERLLDAAEIVFAKKGYDGARLADIAREAGCSVGAVYFRFKDKSALFSAIAESFIEDARTGFAALLGQAPARQDQLVRLFVSASAASFQRHRGLFRAIVERGIEHPQAMRSIFRFRDELAESLERALHGARHASTDISVRVMTQMVYGFLLAGILNEHAPTRIDDRRAIEGLADACVAYLTCGKGKP